MKELKLPTIAAVLTLFILALFSFGEGASSGNEEGMLAVSFLDVGQGDATFIESPTGTQVLIDGGADSRVLSELSRVMDVFDTDIDMIIATHPDQDHIGGLIDVLLRYDVKTVMMTEAKNDTPVSEAFLKIVAEEHARVMYARGGQIYDLGSGTEGSTTLAILFPDYDPTNLDSNLSSIVAKLTYGGSSFLFTGDSPVEIEEYLVGKLGTILHSTVLKVGHHGSRTSSSEIFLTTVNPPYAIISAGKDNSYGHPHKEVIDLFTMRGITYKNTAEQGTLFFQTDGRDIWFR